MSVQTLRVADDPLELCRQSTREGWGDGLPLVPPTEERVNEALRFTDRDPDEVLGNVPPSRGEATVRHVAVNAVMAGCLPAYFRVVLAAVDAMIRQQDRFNLYGMQATTNPVGIAGFVNGPVIEQLDFNAGWNSLGQGNQANATVGRAIRLCALNLGGARPGQMDRATHGFPGKYSFFFAENEPASPWDPFHVEHGHEPGASTVTLFGAAGNLNMLEFTDDGHELARVMAASIRFPTNNDYLCNGEPWLVVSPEHADTLRDAGYDKANLRQFLWEHARIPIAEFTRRTLDYIVRAMWEPVLGELTEETSIPPAEKPEHIRIVVSGGPSVHSQYVPTFGDTRHLVVPIVNNDGEPILDFTVPAR
ncbi:MAG: hypothetical protein GEU78_13860 [Actinobacteria bacterium]|nr:hypothetical protein [Actinomycetota bacterium]